MWKNKEFYELQPKKRKLLPQKSKENICILWLLCPFPSVTIYTSEVRTSLSHNSPVNYFNLFQQLHYSLCVFVVPGSCSSFWVQCGRRGVDSAPQPPFSLLTMRPDSTSSHNRGKLFGIPVRLGGDNTTTEIAQSRVTLAHI